MQFEVTDKREEREGLILKKTIYKATANIHFNDEEYETLKSMATSKEWRDYPLGEFQLGEKIRRPATMIFVFNDAKKTKTFRNPIRTALPEERELFISEIREIATNLKQVLAARLSALNASDEDVLEEI